MAEDITVHVVKYPDRDNLVMRYRCPLTGKQVSRSTGTPRRKDAEKIAAKWEAEVREGRYQTGGRIGWEEFVNRWQDACGPNIKHTTWEMYQATFNAFERHVRPQRLSDLTTPRVTAFAAALRADGLSEASVKRHLSKLQAAARWAFRQELLPKLPTFEMPKKAGAKMKGRPVTGEEFDRMLDAVPEVVIEKVSRAKMTDEAIEADPRVESWRTLLRGLWWSGLRLGEALALRWDQQPGGVWVILDGRRSMLAFDAESQKSGKVELVPLAPEAAEMLESMKRDRGYVFAPRRLRGPETMQRTRHKVGQIISKIGDAAGILVNVETEKTASAHDLRRSFGFRWARRVMPAELMHLMRHQDIKTTMTFYAGHDAKVTAGALWDALGTNLGTIPKSEPSSEPETPCFEAPTAGIEPATPALGKPCSIP